MEKVCRRTTAVPEIVLAVMMVVLLPQPSDAQQITSRVLVTAGSPMVLPAPADGEILAVPSAGTLHHARGVAGAPLLTWRSGEREESLELARFTLSSIHRTLTDYHYAGLIERRPYDGSDVWLRENPEWMAIATSAVEALLAATATPEVIEMHRALRAEVDHAADRANIGATVAEKAANAALLERLRSAEPRLADIKTADLLTQIERATVALARRRVAAIDRVSLDVRPRVRGGALAINDPRIREYDFSFPSLPLQGAGTHRFFLELPYDGGVSPLGALRNYWQTFADYDLLNDRDRLVLARFSTKPTWAEKQAEFLSKLDADRQKVDDESRRLERQRTCFVSAMQVAWARWRSDEDHNATTPVHLRYTDADRKHRMGAAIANSAIGCTFDSQEQVDAMAERAYPIVKRAIADPDGPRLFGWYVDRISRTPLRVVGDVLAVATADDDLILGSYAIPMKFESSSDLSGHFRRLAELNPYEQPFARATLQAAVALSNAVLNTNTLSELKDGLRLKRSFEATLDAELTSLADQLRSLGRVLQADYRRASRSYDGGRFYVAEPAEVENVYVRAGQRVKAGDKLVSVVPVLDRTFEVTVADTPENRRLLRVGRRFAASFDAGDALLPTSTTNRTAILRAASPAALRVLRSLNAAMLSSTSVTTEVTATAEAARNGSTHLLATLTVLRPEAIRCVTIPAAGIGGEGAADARRIVVSSGYRVRDENGGVCVVADGGLLQLDATYDVTLAPVGSN